MTAIRIYTDEDVYGSVTVALRREGYDSVSTPEMGRLRESDESQLRWAAAQGRVLVSFNVGHFAAQHREWLRRSLHHAGIIVSQQRPIGEMLRRLLHLASTLEADEMRDRLEFLSDW
jgi:hypothetical protein